MGRERTTLVVTLTAEGLCAVLVGVGSRTRVRSSVVCGYPEGLDLSSASDLGGWLRASLEEAGIRERRVVIALERRDVVLKRLSFGGVADPEVDLPGMVRYSMVRQLAFSSEGAAIDYQPLGERETGEWDVLAAVATGDRITHLREVFEAAGLKIERIGLTSEGLAAIAELEESLTGSVRLVVGEVFGGLECAVIDDAGLLRLARWSPMDGVEVDEVAAETKRTWLSAQVEGSIGQVAHCLLVGEGLGEAREACESVLGRRVVVHEPALSGEQPPAAALPLIGVAMRGACSGIDLANPKSPPDRSAKKRSLVLAAILAVIVVYGGIWTVAKQRVASMEKRVAVAEDAVKGLRTMRVGAIREAARYEHARRWVKGADVFAHLEALQGTLPEREKLVLSGLRMSVGSAVGYERERAKRKYDAERWVASLIVSLDVEARAATMLDADAWRTTLVADDRYEARTSGSDGATARDERYPSRIDLRLTTRLAAPEAEPSAEPGTEDDGGGS